MVDSVRAVTVCDKEDLRRSLMALAEKSTVAADLEFDEHGKVIKRKRHGPDLELDNTVIREVDVSPLGQQGLFGTRANDGSPRKKQASRSAGKRKSSKRKA